MPVVPGDSGAWVIQDGRLCGHIVAGRRSLRWAYMIPIERIFDEIKSCLNTSDVSVLNTSALERIRQRPISEPLQLPETNSPSAEETTRNVMSSKTDPNTHFEKEDLSMVEYKGESKDSSSHGAKNEMQKDDPAKAEEPETQDEVHEYLSGIKLTIIVSSLSLSVLLVSVVGSLLKNV
jgi:hypothetical protein